MKLTKLRARIENDWEGTSTLPVIMCIFEEVSSKADFYIDSNSTLLTFKKILQRSKNLSFSNEEILASVNYLLDPNINFLITKYEYQDENGMFQLTAEDIIEASTDGFLIHDLTGIQLHDYQSNVIVTFALNSNVVEV